MADVSAHPHPLAHSHQQPRLTAEDVARFQRRNDLAGNPAAAAAAATTKVPVSKGKKSAGEKQSASTKRRKTAATAAVAAAPPLPGAMEYARAGSVSGSGRPLGAPPTAMPPHIPGAHIPGAHAHASMSYPSVPGGANGVPPGADGRAGSGAGFASAAASLEIDALRGARAVFVSPGVVTLGDAAPTRPGQYDVAPLPVAVAAAAATPSAPPPMCVAPPRSRPFVGIPSTRAAATHTARGRPMGVPEKNASEWKIATDLDALKLQMRLSAHDAALRNVAPECVPVMARAAAAFIERTFKRCIRARDEAAAAAAATTPATAPATATATAVREGPDPGGARGRAEARRRARRALASRLAAATTGLRNTART